MYSRYNAVYEFLNTDAVTGIGIYKKALEQEQERRVWEHYLAISPNYTKETFKTYSEFLNEHKHPSLKQVKKPVTEKKQKSMGEVVSLAERISAKYRKVGE